MEEGFTDWCRHLGSLASFLEIQLGENEELRVFASDMTEFSHVFQVSDDRARRNTFIPESPATSCDAKAFSLPLAAIQRASCAFCTLSA